MKNNEKQKKPGPLAKILWGLLVLATLYTLAGHLIFNWAREKLETAINGAVKKISGLQVKISDTTLPQLLSGRVGQVDLYAEEVELENAPRFSSVSATVKGLVGNRRQITSVKEAKVLIVLKQDDLNRFIRQRAELQPPFPRVELEKDLVKARVRLPLIKAASPISVEGQVRVRDGNKLDFVPAKVDFLGNRVPRQATGILADRINPMLDLSQVKPTVVIEDFKIGDKYIRVFGRIELREPIRFR